MRFFALYIHISSFRAWYILLNVSQKFILPIFYKEYIIVDTERYVTFIKISLDLIKTKGRLHKVSYNRRY